MLKRIIFFALLAFFAAPDYANTQDSGNREKIEIVTTLFPTYDFARQIGKDKVNVSLLLPPGIEPHSFEPKPADVVRISKADIFIYTGKYMEPWAEDMIKGAVNKNLMAVDASQGIALTAEEDNDKEQDNHKGGQEDGRYHHGGKDPHIWLDLGNAQVMINTVAMALAQRDAGNKDFYLNNAQEYNAKLAELDGRFKDTFSGCKRKTIVSGGHFTFGYFVRRYGLRYVSAYEGFSPNAEPSPRAIAELINKLKDSGARYVYYEELLDPKVPRIISQEAGARLELLQAAHNVSKDELKRGVGYLEIMEDNLRKLKLGLECE